MRIDVTKMEPLLSSVIQKEVWNVNRINLINKNRGSEFGVKTWKIRGVTTVPSYLFHSSDQKGWDPVQALPHHFLSSLDSPPNL